MHKRLPKEIYYKQFQSFHPY